MENIRPMETILDIWAKSLSCPICNQTGLMVIREAGVPDILGCGRCKSEFNFAQGGTQVRLVKVPEVFGSAFLGEWLTYSEIRQRVYHLTVEIKRAQTGGKIIAKTQSSTTDAKGNVRLQMGDADEVIYAKAKSQVTQLLALGNSLTDIERIIRRNKFLSEEQIETLLYEASKKSSRRSLVSGLTAAALLLITVFAFVFIFSSGILNTFVSEASQAFNDRGGLIPVTGEENLVDGAFVGFCPSTQQQASNVFGGKANGWHMVNSVWIYQDFQVATIYIPAGMMGTYPSASADFFIRKVAGPIQVTNVLLISVTCNP